MMCRSLSWSIFLFSQAFLVCGALGSAPHLVRDINTGLNTAGSDPQNFCVVGATVFFTATTAMTGTELWKSDGTAEGTVMVKDIRAGSDSSHPTYLTAVGSTLFFRANDGTHGLELWKSDGTAAGTVMVRDIVAGSDFSKIDSLTAVGSTLFFQAYDTIHGDELWKSDGTEAGTMMVKNIIAGSGSSYLLYLTAAGNTLYFRADDGTHGHELWKSDGTEAGTMMVKDIRAGSGFSYPLHLTAVGSTLYFQASDGINGAELWKSDGTAAGTVMVRDIDAGSRSSDPEFLTRVGSTLFFRADDGTNGEELWKSDGTAAGTVLVKNILAGSNSSAPNSLTSVGGTLYFQANNGANANGYELWKSNGTAAGTVMVKDIIAGGSSSYPESLAALGSTLYFQVNDGINGAELWKSDGTAAGTVMVKDIVAGSGSSDPDFLTMVDSTLYFRADDGTHGKELWKSDGTPGGTVMVENILAGSNPSAPDSLTEVGSTLYFRAFDPTNGHELWKSDGTAEGTVMVKDIVVGSGSSYPDSLTAVGSTLYFRAYDGINGQELWKSDGTAAGTVMVKDILSGSGSSEPYHLTSVGGTLYFRAFDGSNGYELWKSDGTAAGTVMVKDIRAGSGSSSPDYLTAVGSTLYFRASDNINGSELWKSDGTATGTVMVKVIRAGSGSVPEYLTEVGNTLYFVANDGAHGKELWKSDGTAAGTVMVADIWTGSSSSEPYSLTAVGDTLYFRAFTPTIGHQVWRSNGTAEGTAMVKAIDPGGSPSFPGYLTAVGGTLYFVANDGTNGDELWKSDGTADGTAMVQDIAAGSGSSSPSSLTAVGSNLYFRANDGANGYELWKSDGTAAGTVMVHDIASGSGSSDPDVLTAVGSTLFFSAQTEEAGCELWRLPPPDPPSVTNPTASSITADTATLGGTVTSDGGSAITERGVVWSVNSNNNEPYIDGPGVTKVVGTGTTGVFTAPVTGLNAATTHAYRAYAVNSEGVSYSSTATFLTQSANSDLSSLSLGGADLAPTFDAATTSYISTVSNATQSLTVTATRSEELSTLEIGVNGGAYGPLTSGTASALLALSVGSNTINVRVTAQAGNTKTYTVTVIRDKAPQTITFNNPGPQVANAPLSLAATGGGSGNAVTFTVEGPGQIDEGDLLTFTGTGSVTVRANQAGNNLYHAASEVARSFIVSAASASVSISNTVQIYNASPRSITVTTTPLNLAHSVTYSGEVEIPADAGTYQANVTITDPRYSGSGSAYLVIQKAPQSITFHPIGNRSVEETVILSATGGNPGEPVSFSVTSGPASITGNHVTFSEAGTVQITATQAGNQNYDAAAPVMQSFDVTLPATVHLRRLHQVADGSAREVIVATDPPGLATETTYNGSDEPPLLPGSYLVETLVTEPNYEGSGRNTLVVDDPARFKTVSGGTMPAISDLGALDEATFQIAAYETIHALWVTVATWAEANAGYDFDNVGGSTGADIPITGISWYDAAKWCNALTEWENLTLGRSSAPAYRVGGNVFKTGTPAAPTDLTCDFSSSGYRLPTATEWEFAARGGPAAAATIYPGGDSLDPLGWFAANSGGAGGLPVGDKTPNALGLHDLAGNAAEWTWDAPPMAQTQRLLRGGSWQSPAAECQLNRLTGADPSIRASTAGLRVARSVALALAPALDQDGLSWNSGGDFTWLAQNLTTYDGSDAAESVLSSAGQSNWIETTVSGPCNMHFRWKVTGETLDLITLSVDGQAGIQTSGTSGWSEQFVELPAGSHNLRWTHTRASNSGKVSAWLDTVSIEPTTIPTVSTYTAGEITNADAILGGEVADDGGRAVTVRGVVYDISPMPKVESANELPATTAGTGAFTVPTSGLSPGTTYYARAYAINNVGTSYGQEIVFTTRTPVVFSSGMASYDRSILPDDRQAFTFTLDGPGIVNLSTTGGTSLRAVVRDGSGNVIVSYEGDGNFAFEELLGADTYTLEISRLPGVGEAQNFHLDIDASEVAASRPDVSVGPTATAATGRQVYLPSGQMITLTSKKARPVTGYAVVANRDNLPDAISVRGPGGNGFFAVSYFVPSGNVTAQLLTGTYRTSELESNDSGELFRVAITPNKQKLVTRTKKGIKLLRKTLMLSLTATSTADPSQRDTGAIKVQVQ